MKRETYVPTEAEEQAALFRWAQLAQGKYPELALLHHIPNGGYRDKREAAMLRREGVRAGVPDLCLPVARCGCHGLYIELKRRKGGRISPDQLEWMEQLRAQGYQVALCYGWEEAKSVIEQYLREKLPSHCDDVRKECETDESTTANESGR